MENPIDDKKLEEALVKVLEWSNETFPTADVRSVTSHLLEEMQELSVTPNDPGEMADVLMLIAHLEQKLDLVKRWVYKLAEHHGIDVVKAVLDKLEVCRKRTWGTPDENGVVRHLPHG